MSRTVRFHPSVEAVELTERYDGIELREGLDWLSLSLVGELKRSKIQQME
jgi:hypothetical protein